MWKIYIVANVEEYHNEPFGRYGQLPRFQNYLDFEIIQILISTFVQID